MKRIYVCSPTSYWVNPEYMASVVNASVLLERSGLAQVKFDLEIGAYIHHNRNSLVHRAREHEADGIIWVDSDMRFPEDSFRILLGHDRDFVGVNYRRKQPPYLFTAARISDTDPSQIQSVPTTDDSKGLEQVSVLGFGLVYTSMKLFRNWQEPFDYILGSRGMSEDYVFCCRSGVDVYVDHDLSKRVCHMTSGAIAYDGKI